MKTVSHLCRLKIKIPTALTSLAPLFPALLSRWPNRRQWSGLCRGDNLTDDQQLLYLRCLGLLAVQLPSTCSTPKGTCHVRAFPTLFPTGAANFQAARPLAVTIGNYFKHLMMYVHVDRRFARHPHLCYFVLNNEMHWHALQAGSIYFRQHRHDVQLSVEELRDMVGREGRCSPTVSCTMPPVYDTILVQAAKSPYCHGGHARSAHSVFHSHNLAWLPDATGVKQALADSEETSAVAKEALF